jgi:hypothetical protein
VDLSERVGADRVAVLQVPDRVIRQHLEDALGTPRFDTSSNHRSDWALFAAVLIVTLQGSWRPISVVSVKREGRMLVPP